MLYGLFELPLWGYILVTLLTTQITIAAVTLFLHRHQAHRALTLHPLVSHFFRFWLWLTTGMVTKQWVAIHRKHHAKVETPEDPHSPQTRGLKKVLLEGAELYRAEARNQETMERYGQGTPDDWLERNIYSKHPILGVATLLIVNLVLFGIPGISIWGIQMLWIPLWAAGVINGIGHYWGYRNSASPDASRNIVPWGFFIGGEELHNNHHAYPQSAKFSIKPWEFDIGWMYLRLLSFFKLAKVKQRAPQLSKVKDKAITAIDGEALKALFASRFEVLSHYTHQVVMPVLKREKSKASVAKRRLFMRAKRLLRRHEALLDQMGRDTIKNALAESQRLEIVVQYRERLQAIWQKTTANQKELLEALQDWCRQAEATGIDVLEDFAHSIRSYRVKIA